MNIRQSLILLVVQLGSCLSSIAHIISIQETSLKRISKRTKWGWAILNSEMISQVWNWKNNWFHQNWWHQNRCHQIEVIKNINIVTTPTQPQHNLNLTQLSWVWHDYCCSPHPTTHPTTHPQTLLPSNAASDQPFILPKQQHEH